MSKYKMVFLIIAIILGLAEAGYIAKLFMSSAAPPTPEKTEARKEYLPEVETMTVENSNVVTSMDIQGELVAFNKINIFSEVGGILKSTSKPFKVGTWFAKGDLMLALDDTEAKLALLSQKSALQNAITQLMPDLKIDYPSSFAQWKKYLDDFDVEKPIAGFPKPLNDQEKYFIASRNLLTQFYNIRSGETRLSKFNIYAPFSGILTMANTNPGALVSPGQNLGELMNNGVYELQATVPLSDLEYLKPGNVVRLISDGIDGSWSGKVKRIGDQIDRQTQTATVFIGVSGKNLREGMYLRGKGNGEKIENALKIPRKLLVNQNAVFVVNNDLLALEEVEVVKMIEAEAIVTGLEDGTRILKEVVPGLSAGMKVNPKN